MRENDYPLMVSHDEASSESWIYLVEVFGMQIYLLVLGYLIVMRLNETVKRWDDGCLGVIHMLGKWADAHATFISFVDSETTNDPLMKRKLRAASWMATHYFSLMHACALISLKECEGQRFGSISESGIDAIGNQGCLFNPAAGPGQSAGRSNFGGLALGSSSRN